MNEHRLINKNLMCAMRDAIEFVLLPEQEHNNNDFVSFLRNACERNFSSTPQQTRNFHISFISHLNFSPAVQSGFIDY